MSGPVTKKVVFLFGQPRRPAATATALFALCAASIWFGQPLFGVVFAAAVADIVENVTRLKFFDSTVSRLSAGNVDEDSAANEARSRMTRYKFKILMLLGWSGLYMAVYILSHLLVHLLK